MSRDDFSKLDKNGDGQISRTEWDEYFRGGASGSTSSSSKSPSSASGSTSSKSPSSSSGSTSSPGSSSGSYGSKSSK
jgi:hypothetical protein